MWDDIYGFEEIVIPDEVSERVLRVKEQKFLEREEKKQELIRNLDVSVLSRLGFLYEDIDLLLCLVENIGKLTRANLSSYMASDGSGPVLSRQEVDYILYMYELASGRRSVDTPEELVDFLKRVSKEKFDFRSLFASTVTDVPRQILIHGISDSNFKIYNTSNSSKVYTVERTLPGAYEVRTKLRPVLEYNNDTKVNGVLSADYDAASDEVILRISKAYARQLGRFIIVVSPKKPATHLGLYKLVMCDGSSLFVYAKQMSRDSSISALAYSDRIYDYGYFESEIDSKLDAVLEGLKDYTNPPYVHDKEEGNIGFDAIIREGIESEGRDDESLVDY